MKYEMYIEYLKFFSSHIFMNFNLRKILKKNNEHIYELIELI